MTSAKWTDVQLENVRVSAVLADGAGSEAVELEPADTIELVDLVRNHRRRDEMVVAVLTKELESGCATGSGTSLAQRVLALYEELADHA